MTAPAPHAPDLRWPWPRPWTVAWLVALLVLAGLWGGVAHWRNHEHRRYLDHFLADASGVPGFSLYELTPDPDRPRGYIWRSLGTGPAREMPVPGAPAGELRHAALAALDLASPRTLVLTARVLGGLKVYVDRRPLLVTYRPTNQATDYAARLDLAPGRHLVRVIHYSAYADPSQARLEWSWARGGAPEFRSLAPGLDPGAARGLELALERWDKLTGLLPLALLAWLGLPAAWAWTREPEAVRRRAAGLAAAIQTSPAWGRARAWYARHQDWLAPLWLWALGVAVTLGALAAAGAQLPQALLDAPWDARRYHSVMVQGYTFQRWGHDLFAGNHPWFPLFPLAGRALLALGIPAPWALTALSWLTGPLAFGLLFRLARRLFGAAAAHWSLVALVAWPGFLYLLIPFPYGLALCLFALGMLALVEGRWWLAGLAAYALALAYPTGVFLAVAAGVTLWPRLVRRPGKLATLGIMAWTMGASAAGVLTICLHRALAFGIPDLTFLSQAYWGYHFAWPWRTLLEALTATPQPPLAGLAALGLALATLACFAHRFQPALWALLAAVLLMSLLGGRIDSSYRQFLMAWPLFLLVGSSPRSPVLKLAFLGAGWLLAWGWYLPAWVGGHLV